jgi:hypothetical protein
LVNQEVKIYVINYNVKTGFSGPVALDGDRRPVQQWSPGDEVGTPGTRVLPRVSVD